MSLLLSGTSDFFGLDIGSTAVRLVVLRGGGGNKTLVKYAYVPLDSKISMSDSKADQQKLGKTVEQLVKQAGVSTRNVAVGIPSSRVFTTVADIDRLAGSDLAKAIPLQADSLIPTPLAESKIDWALLGDSPADKTKQEVLLTSVTNKFVEERLDMLETVGLNVVAFEPDNLAMARALAVADPAPQLLLDVGQHSTDLVILMDNVPHLTRSIPTGVEAIIRAATQNLSIDAKQAEQFVFKFGLSKDKLEGQVFQGISGTIDLLTTEIEKSIKFFSTRYNNAKIERIIVTGGASVIPEFPLYVANKFGINVEIGNAWRNVTFSSDRQNELLAISNQFSVAVGLAGEDLMTIQLNLLPDVKLQYIKAQRSRNLVLTVSVIISLAAVFILVVLLGYGGLQKKHIGDLNKDIAADTRKLQNQPEINKILTVQNQLQSLTDLHAAKPAVANLFTYLNEVTPVEVSITDFSADFTAHTATITGTSDALSSVNKYIDTLKFTKFTTGEGSDAEPAFSDVVLSSFGVNGSSQNSKDAVNYTITLSYKETIFDITQKVKLVVPNVVTTRADLDNPSDLFTGTSAGDNKEGN